MPPHVTDRPSAAATSLRAVPEPWDYNPSNWKQRWTIAILAGVATLIATYMGLYQWRLIPDVWDPLFGAGSRRVLDSDVSHRMRSWFLVPDAILGALAYLGDVLLGLAGSTRRWQFRPWLVLLFGLDVIPLGIVSAILVVLQGAVVGSWCFLCLVTAVISLVLAVLAYDEVWSSALFLLRLWWRERNLPLVWHTFWGAPVGRRPGRGERNVPEERVMWARMLEVVLGVWLILGPFIFAGEPPLAWPRVGGLTVLTFTLLSFYAKLEKIHLANAAVAVGLLGLALLHPTSPPPPAVQNQVVVGLLLLMLAVIPSHASRPPREWREFLMHQRRDTHQS